MSFPSFLMQSHTLVKVPKVWSVILGGSAESSEPTIGSHREKKRPTETGPENREVPSSQLLWGMSNS